MLRLSLAILIVLALTGCKAGSKAETKVNLTGDHLAAMILTRADLGPEYEFFDLDAKSGMMTTEQLVEQSDNPDGEALDVANFGQLLGYLDTYFSYRSLADKSGVVYLTNGVLLYADKKGAAGDLSDMVLDAQENYSGTTRAGSLQTFKSFKAKVGESSRGILIRLLAPGSNFGLTGTINLTITGVEFQRDRMLGEVIIMRFDAKDVQAEAIDLARKLDKRMQTVLAGGSPDSQNASAPEEGAPPQSPPSSP